MEYKAIFFDRDGTLTHGDPENHRPMDEASWKELERVYHVLLSGGEADWGEDFPLVPYPETVAVLEYFQSRGYKMGVISDTFPSLELTLQKAGLAQYFTSFTASTVVGAEKPSAVIFGAALRTQGVTAAESLYVDDCDVEAAGARKLGFTSFLIDRSGERGGEWTIHSLTELIDFVENGM